MSLRSYSEVRAREATRNSEKRVSWVAISSVSAPSRKSRVESPAGFLKRRTATPGAVGMPSAAGAIAAGECRPAWSAYHPAAEASTTATTAVSAAVRQRPARRAAVPFAATGEGSIGRCVISASRQSEAGDSGAPGAGPALAVTSATTRKPRRRIVRMQAWDAPSSPMAWRTALMRVLNAASDTMRPFQIRSMISSLVTTRSRFSSNCTKRSNTCGSTGTRVPFRLIS
jgi:hypothetical protein